MSHLGPSRCRLAAVAPTCAALSDDARTAAAGGSKLASSEMFDSGAREWPRWATSWMVGDPAVLLTQLHRFLPDA